MPAMTPARMGSPVPKGKVRPHRMVTTIRVRMPMITAMSPRMSRFSSEVQAYEPVAQMLGVGGRDCLGQLITVHPVDTHGGPAAAFPCSVRLLAVPRAMRVGSVASDGHHRTGMV